MKSENGEHWIPVETSSGMFSTEWAVTIKLVGGETVSLFADKFLVKKSGGHSLLKVTLIKSDPDHYKQLVLLPTETFETASPWVEVPLGNGK